MRGITGEKGLLVEGGSVNASLDRDELYNIPSAALWDAEKSQGDGPRGWPSSLVPTEGICCSCCPSPRAGLGGPGDVYGQLLERAWALQGHGGFHCRSIEAFINYF